MNKELVNWLSTNLKLNEEQISNLITTSEDGTEVLSDDAISILDSTYVERLNKIKNDQFLRGVKSKSKDISKVLKQNSIEIDGNVEDVLSNYFSSVPKNEDSKKSAKKFSAKQAFELPEVQARIKQEIQKYDDLKTEFDGYKKNIETQTVTKLSRAKAKEIFLNTNPVLSQNEEIKTKQINAFLNSIPYDKLKQDGDNFIPVNDNGERLQNERFDDVSFEDYVLSHNFYETHEADPNKTSTKVDTVYSKTGTPKFKSYAEVTAYMKTEKDPEKVKKAVEEYKKLKEAA